MKLYVNHRFWHWSCAFLIVTLLFMGYYMTYVSDYALYHLHKSLAVIMILLLLPRVVLRAIRPWPSAAQAHQQKLLGSFHWLLLLLTAVMLISGAFYSGYGGYGIALFALPLISKNVDETGATLPINQHMSDLGLQVHIITALVLTVFICVHILAALKHHFINKDDTLTRMLFAKGGVK